MTERIHLSKADVTEVEERYVLEALRSGWIAPLGPDVDAFEKEIAERVGVPHALALSSGTAALHLALLHLGAGPGTVVLVPTLTFAATANAVRYTGAEPVFVDATLHDGNVDAELMLRAADELGSAGYKVAAAMTVDLFGYPCNYGEIETGLHQRGIPLIEDAAEALGSQQGGRSAGSFGAAAALSFNGNKILTTSGGGMLLSHDGALIDHARKLATQAREGVAWYEHTEIGFNYRMSNILAALGRAQLTRLDAMVKRRREIHTHYRTGLSEHQFRILGPDENGSKDQANRWLTVLVSERDRFDVNATIAYLNAHGIEARHVWKPMHRQPAYSHYKSIGGHAAEQLFANGIVLPSGASLSDNDVETVIAVTKRAVSSV